MVAISNSTSLIEGQTALISCIGWGPPSIEITWAYDEQMIMNSASFSISQVDVIQSERLFKHSVLQICSVEMANAGAYSCIVSNVNNSVNSSTQLAVSGKSILALAICTSNQQYKCNHAL